MNKKLSKVAMIILLILALLAIAVGVFMSRPEFGRLPEGERKAKIEKSLNFRDGKFQNLNPTLQMTGDKSTFGAMIDFIFKKSERQAPQTELPSVKTNLKNLSKDDDILVWFGHSSLFVQLNGVTFLFDPVFSDYASPVPYTNRSFKGANVYSSEDMPKIDYLIFTHDHWDHMDYPTIKKLKDSVDKIISPLGVGSHLEYWGFDKDNITELDWNESAIIKNNIEIFCLPARHFSGRTMKRDQTLWASFLIKSNDYKFYHSADSGYDTHFKAIGEKFGGVDFATLENGQYNNDWKFIHMMPEETVQAAKDLGAKRAMPVHNSKFVLSRHAWDDPMKDVTSKAESDGTFRMTTPMIGEKVDLRNDNQTFEKWWEKAK